MPVDLSASSASIDSVISLGGRRPRFFYLVSLPLWLATVLRSFDPEGDASNGPLTVALLLSYLLLLVSSDRISRSYRWYENIYFGLQLSIVLVVMVLQPELDFFPVLLIPISAQIALVSDRLRRRGWFLAALAVMALGLLAFQEFPINIALILLYGAGYFLIASYVAMIEQVEYAESQARALVQELQDANRQLIANAATIEQLAIVEERNRLARELHDSVSQSLYGLLLNSEAARRHLASGDAGSLGSELDAMSDGARTALAEMRLLIYELRPSEIEEQGLLYALQTRLATVERRAGLQATLDYEVGDNLPLRSEIELERIVAEALTNAVRHGGASSVRVAVWQEQDRLLLSVTDDGIGFDPGETSIGFGIRGMRERAGRLGGTIEIESRPGTGTRVWLEAPL